MTQFSVLNDAALAPTQLLSADPADWPVAPGWQPLVQAFFEGAVGGKLRAFLQARLEAGAVIFPPRPLRALELIDRFRVTHSQWVPTMFVRLLALPEDQRRRFDLSSHRVAIHAAAPCPVV